MKKRSIRSQFRIASLQEKPKIRTISSTKKVKKLIEYWNNLGLKPALPAQKIHFYHKENVTNLKRLLRGTLFNQSNFFQQYHNRKFTEEEICSVFEKFAVLVMENSGFSDEMVQKRAEKTNLGKFLFNPWYRSIMGKSLFLYYFVHDPDPISKDLYPKITERLIMHYTKKVLLGVGKVNYYDKRKFVKGSILLIEFFERNKGKIKQNVYLPDLKKADLLFEAIKESVRGDMGRISPLYFYSDRTFNEALPKYLISIGIIKEIK